MNILVCIKPVPDPEKYGQLQMDPKTKRLVREGIPSVINPADRNALEEALRIRSAYGGRITVLSMAPVFSRDKIMESLAMGADAAYLISDAAFGGADTYATSYVLAAAVRKMEKEGGADATSGAFDLILAGNESADGATAHVPVQLARWLGLPHLCNVNRIEIAPEAGKEAGSGAGIKLWKKTETGRLVLEGRLPVVAAVTKDINKPRLVNAMGIIQAKKKPLTIWSNAQLQLDPRRTGLAGSPTQPGELMTPDLARQAEDLGSDAKEAAGRILAIIEKAGV